MEDLRQIYAAVDHKVSDLLRGHTVSCKKGCSHCCYMLTACTRTEALLIAKDLVEKSAWEEPLRRCAKAGKALAKVRGRHLWFQHHIPCPVLDTNTGLCSAYESRPIVCRLYYVVSDPSVCADKSSEVVVATLNMVQTEHDLLMLVGELEGTQIPFSGPIQQMLPLALASVLSDKKKYGWARRLAEKAAQKAGDPRSWASNYAHTINEDTDDVKQAMHRAMLVGLINRKINE